MYYSKTFENIRCNRLLDAGFKILSEDSIHCNELSNKYRENLKFINYDDFKNIEYSEEFWDKIAEAIALQGFAIIDNYLSQEQAAWFRSRIDDKEADDEFRRAGIWKDLQFQKNLNQRGDLISWI